MEWNDNNVRKGLLDIDYYWLIIMKLLMHFTICNIVWLVQELKINLGVGKLDLLPLNQKDYFI